MSVDGVGGSNAVQQASMEQLVGSGDMESVLLAFGIERASDMEKLVKAKIADMRARNGEIQSLQRALQELRAVKPDKDEPSTQAGSGPGLPPIGGGKP